MKHLKLLTLCAISLVGGVFFSNTAFAENPADCVEVRLLHSDTSNRVETFAQNRCIQDIDVVFYNNEKTTIGIPHEIALQNWSQVMPSIYGGNIYYAACFTTDDDCELQKSLDENTYRGRSKPTTERISSSTNKAASCLRPYLDKAQGSDGSWLYVQSTCSEAITAKFYDGSQNISSNINLRGNGDKELVTDRVPQGEICWIACFHREKDAGNNPWGMCSFQTFDGEYFTGRKPDTRGDSISACTKVEPVVSAEEELAEKEMENWIRDMEQQMESCFAGFDSSCTSGLQRLLQRAQVLPALPPEIKEIVQQTLDLQ